MDILRRFCISFIILIVIIGATANDSNDTLSMEDRQSRALGRIVKLYAGIKPEPVICTGEGFQKDPHNCAVFYRCMKSGNGKYTVFRFQCGPGTVYDPDTEVCNHPRSTKRSECGGFVSPTEHTTHINEIEVMHHEIPSPIVTKQPMYVASPSTIRTTILTGRPPLQFESSTKREDALASSPYPWGSPISNVYIDDGAMAYPLKPTATTTRPLILPSQGTFTTAQSTITNLPHSNPRDNICKSDGFMGDSENCRKFYRCVGNQRGGYTRYEFSCTETTVWDDENQICNHAWAVKRSRCGHGYDKINSNSLSTTRYPEKDDMKHNIKDNRFNSTIQQQLQISYGSKVTQTQTQISKGPAVQNQTQIHYGDRINPVKNSISKQNQTQFSYGSAVSQSQTQVNYGNKGIQTQLQIDHSKEASQSQVQVNESFKATSTSTENTNSGITNTQTNNECTKVGFMGDSNDCKKFYRCVDSGRSKFIKYEFSCSEGTVWDQKIEACNHAWAVKECGSKTPHEPATSTMSTQPIITTSTHKTTAYYTTTTTTENYQIISDSGDKEDNGYQRPELTPTSSASTVRTSTLIDNSNKAGECTSSGFIGDNNDCKVFYRCVENGNGGYVKHEFKCGEGTVWDPEIEACNHAWAVKKCGGSASPSVSEVDKTTSKPIAPSSTQPSSSLTPHSTTSTENYQIPDNEDSGYQQPEQIPVSTTATSTTIGNPKGGECTSSGFIGDNNDCKVFYRCVENGNGGYVKYEFKCGEGTVWDPEIEACNHAWAVKKCGSNASPAVPGGDTTTRKPTAPSATQLPTHSTTSTEYYQTPDTVNSGNEDSGYQQPEQIPVSTTTTSTTIGSSKGGECTSSGFIGDNNDCKVFYRCIENGNGGYVKYEFKCGEGTVWDPEIEACNHAWAVKKCGSNASPAVSEGDTTTRKPTAPSATQLPTHLTTSTEYYQMPDTINTDNDDSGYQQPEQIPVSTTTTLTTIGSSTGTECTASGFIADENDCKLFYRCVENGNGGYVKYEFKCGEGTVWDPEIEACNHAWAVKKCGGSLKPDTTETTTKVSSIPPTSTSHSTTQLVSNIDYADEQDPGYGPWHDDTSTTNTSKQPQTTNIVCQSNGFIGDKYNCKKFYRCVDNGEGGFISYEFTCSEGTVWDSKIDACNHEWAVEKCGGNTSTSNDQETVSSSTEMISNISSTTSSITTTTTTVTSTDSNVCKQSGYMRDAKNCKKFYRCVDKGDGSFTKYEYSCGEGTLWDQEIEACNHAWAVTTCNSSAVSSSEQHETTSAHSPPIDDETDNGYQSNVDTDDDVSVSDQPFSTTDTTITSSGTCTTEGFYGDSYNCKKFYRCVENGQGGYTKYDFTCGEGTVWDQDLQTCNHDLGKCSSSSGIPSSSDHSQNGDYTTISTTTENKHTTTSILSSTSSTVGNCHSEGFFADPNDCRKFIRCVQNDRGGFTKYQFTCAEGTIWVQDILACDHETEEAQCNSQSATQPATPENQQQVTEKYEPSTTSSVLGDENNNNTGPSTGSNMCSSEGYYGNKNDCRKFYRCVDNGHGGYTKYEYTCSEGTAWDTEIQACNHIEQVSSCQGSVLHEEDNNPTTQSSTTSSQDSSITTTSSTTQQTTDASKPGSESTTQNSQKTESCDSEGFFGNKQDCTKFYRCVDNGNGGYTKYDFTCAEGTIWDQDLTTCNHPGDVVNPSCNSTDDNSSSEGSSSSNSPSAGSSSTTTQSTTQGQSQSGTSSKPDNKNVNCTKAGFYPNPNDCKKFYRCVDWDGDGTKFSVFHFECGEGTIWDPALETCNHEESVYPPRDCSGSQSQTENQPSTTESTTTIQEETTSETTSSTTADQSSTTTESTTSTTTEQSSEGTTANIEETTTEQTSESTTEKQGESTTEKQGENTTENQGESTTEESSEGTTEKPSETTTQQTENGTTEQTTTTTEESAEGTTEKQGESTTDNGTTEQSGDNTTEGTTENSEQSTTEQTESTTQEASTTESSKDEQSTTEESIEESTTEQSMTEGSTTETATETSTNESSGNKECPDTEEDQYLYVCPSSFRRHPKYCNLFYQCDENEETHEIKVAVFTCPNGTIYDESQTKCVEESKSQKECEGEIAQKRRVKRKNFEGHNDPIVVNNESHACSSTGYYAFEKDGDCSPGFLKCKTTKTNRLRAFVYQCPEGYIFWSVSRRCERIDRVKDCRRSVLNSWSKRWEIPIENKNVAWI